VCTGSLDFLARSLIREAVAGLLNDDIGDPKVVLDLRGVSMIDSAGLGALVQALRLCDDQAAASELLPSAAVRRILALVGLGRINSAESGGWLTSGGYGEE
jgi:anti-anti-sigma factor